MIDVIATVKIVSGKRDAFLEVCKGNLANVQAENGCISYYPVVDLDTGVPTQDLDSDRVLIIERWESLEALKVHMTAPHMLTFREAIKDLVEETRIKVLQQA